MESNHNHQQNNKLSLIIPGITNQVMISYTNLTTQSLQALNVPRSNTSPYSSPSSVVDPPEPDLDDEEQQEEPNQQYEEVDELGLGEQEEEPNYYLKYL